MRLILLAACGLLLTAGSSRVQRGQTPRAVAEAMVAAIDRHDAAALAALYAEDAVVTASDSCKSSIGPEAVRKGHEALVRAMPDLRLAATDWVVSGDRVAVLLTARSKALGPSDEMVLADFLTVRNGRIIRDVTIFNPGEPCR